MSKKVVSWVETNEKKIIPGLKLKIFKILSRICQKFEFYIDIFSILDYSHCLKLQFLD